MGETKVTCVADVEAAFLAHSPSRTGLACNPFARKAIEEYLKAH